jgi:hypothetical protein
MCAVINFGTLAVTKPDSLVTWLVWQTMGDEEQAEGGELALGDTFANEELIADEDPNMYATPSHAWCMCLGMCVCTLRYVCVRYATRVYATPPAMQL